MIYLASPYSHPDPLVRKTRFLLAEQCTAALLNAGKFAYSPIVHWHQLSITHNLPSDHTFWLHLNIDFLRRSDALYVLAIDGWERSKGVAQEMRLAADMCLPTVMVNEDGLFV